MDVKGLGATGYLRDYGAKSRKSVPGKSYLEKTENKNVLEKVTPSKQISIEDIYDKMKQGNKEIDGYGHHCKTGWFQGAGGDDERRRDGNYHEPGDFQAHRLAK